MLLYSPSNKDDLESFQLNGHAQFTDVTAAQFNSFIYEDRSDSRDRNLNSERLRVAGLAYEAAPELFDDVEADLIEGSGHAIDTINAARRETAALQNKVRASDYEGIVEPNLEYLKSVNPDILNRDEIDQTISENAAVLRAKLDDKLSRATQWDAFWGTMIGAGGGAMTDPINMSAMMVGGLVLGAGKAAGGAFLSSLGRVMGTEFVINAASESAIQLGAVYDYKKEINSPWELRDSLIAIGGAGIGSAFLSGAFHTIGRGWNKLVDKGEIKPTHAQRQFFNDLMIGQKLVDELKHGAKNEMELNARLRVLTDVMADLRAGRTPDLSHLDAKIDKEQLGWADAEIASIRIKLDKFIGRRQELEQQFDEGIYQRQVELAKWTEQKMSPLEERSAREAAGVEVSRELDQDTALEDIRFDQQKAYESAQAQESLRANDLVNQATHELRASRRDHGDMLKIKEEIDTIDSRFDEQAKYLKVVQKAKEDYLQIRAEETRQQIKVAEHDSEAVKNLKNIVNKYLADSGVDGANIKIFESDFDVKVRDNVYRIKHKKSGDIEINGGVKAAEFRAALDAAMRGNKNAGSVDMFDADYYLDHDLYLVDGGKAGFAINDEGTIVSLFKASDSTIGKALDSLIPLAVENGATKLEAFDGFLTKGYSKYGFEEYDRIPWNEKYKPDNWNDELGTPDLVFMKLNRDKYYDYATKTSSKTLQDLRGIQRSNGQLRKAAESAGGDREGWREGRSYAPLKDAPAVTGFSGPDPRLVEVAENYAAANGIELKRQSEYVDVDVERAGRIADAYDQMAHAPNDPVVREAYENLVQQTVAQYEALISAGYRFWFTDNNAPSNMDYLSTPWNAMRDIRENKTMGIYPTNDGFGASEFDPAANPLLADTGLTWPVGGPDSFQEMPVLANDLFRAVHDAFGHGLEGTGFRARGEENAWQAHIRLFKGSAKAAITTETRGQNSWLNYGPHGESNRTAKVEDTVFADQKTGLMPEWTWKEGLVGDEVVEQASRVIHFDKDTGELFLNASAIKDADHLSDLIRGELGKHYDLGKARTSVSGVRPSQYVPTEQVDEADFDKEVAEVLAGKEDDIPIHDADGNPTNYRASLEQSEKEIQGYESIKVCML